VDADLGTTTTDSLLLALAPGVDVGAEVFVRSWLADEEAQRMSADVSVASAPAPAFIPGVVELVLLPLGVGVASSALYDLVKRVVASARRSSSATEMGSGLEVVDIRDGEGRRVLVVRLEDDRP
jgi:hypothetical protein